MHLSDFAGKPVVVNFWASWCPPCRSELPAFDSLYAEYGDRIQFMMVDLTDGNRETMPGVKVFVTEQGFQFPVYYDYDRRPAANAYQIFHSPPRPPGRHACRPAVAALPEGPPSGPIWRSCLKSYINKL